MDTPERPAETPLAAAMSSQAIAVPDPSGPPSPVHPVRMEIGYPPELNRWLPLVKWFLLAPHYIVLIFIGIGAFFVHVFAFFAVLFTGRWPRGAFDYTVRVHVDYPEHVANWRPLVQWLLAIPYLIVAGALYWLTGILTIAAFFTILFTKEIPRGVFELMVPGLRWNLRGTAYADFTTDRSPPFIWG